MAINLFSKPGKVSKYQPIRQPYPIDTFSKVSTRLTDRYRKAKALEDKRKRSIEKLQSSPFAKDNEFVQQVADFYAKRGKERAKAGDYENMLPETREDAAAVVNKLQPVRQHIKDYQEWVDNIKNMEDVNPQTKQRWIKLITKEYKNRQGGVDWDRGNLEVTGGMFQGEQLVPDVNISEKAMEIAEGWKKSGKESIAVKKVNPKTGGHYIKTVDIQGVSEEELVKYARQHLMQDPEVQAYAQQRARIEAGLDSQDQIDAKLQQYNQPIKDNEGEIVKEDGESIKRYERLGFDQSPNSLINELQTQYEEAGLDTEQAREKAKRQVYQQIRPYEMVGTASEIAAAKEGFRDKNIDIDANFKGASNNSNNDKKIGDKPLLTLHAPAAKTLNKDNLSDIQSNLSEVESSLERVNNQINKYKGDSSSNSKKLLNNAKRRKQNLLAAKHNLSNRIKKVEEKVSFEEAYEKSTVGPGFGRRGIRTGVGIRMSASEPEKEKIDNAFKKAVKQDKTFEEAYEENLKHTMLVGEEGVGKEGLKNFYNKVKGNYWTEVNKVLKENPDITQQPSMVMGIDSGDGESRIANLNTRNSQAVNQSLSGWSEAWTGKKRNLMEAAKDELPGNISNYERSAYITDGIDENGNPIYGIMFTPGEDANSVAEEKVIYATKSEQSGAMSDAMTAAQDLMNAGNPQLKRKGAEMYANLKLRPPLLQASPYTLKEGETGKIPNLTDNQGNSLRLKKVSEGQGNYSVVNEKGETVVTVQGGLDQLSKALYTKLNR